MDQSTNQLSEFNSVLRLSNDLAASEGGFGSSFFTVTDQIFEDVRVSALLNPTGDSNDQVVLLARGDLSSISSYNAGIDFAENVLLFSKTVNGQIINFDLVPNILPALDQPYFVELEVVGNQLTARFFDETGNDELFSLSATDDDPLIAGTSGLAVNVSIQFQDFFDDPNDSTFDNFSSQSLTSTDNFFLDFEEPLPDSTIAAGIGANGSLVLFEPVIDTIEIVDDTVHIDFDTEIFRFRTTINNQSSYLYSSGDEAENIRANFADTFTEEGLAFKVSSETQDELLDLYRFRSTQGTYIYVGEDERNSINSDSELATVFTEEGRAFSAYSPGSGEATEFYRFRNLNSPNSYLYATGAEAEAIRSQFSDSFVEEGAAFEAEI